MATAILGRELTEFLADLKKHNERVWFQANKERFVAAVERPLLAFIEALAPRLKKVSPHVAVEAKKAGGSLQRIYRDTRFSKDKSPYHTHVAAQFRHRQAKDLHVGFYLRIDPAEVTLGTGIWQPEAPALAKIRRAIVARAKDWTRARDDKKLRARWGALAGESLKRPPPGFDAEHPLIEDLKRKDFVAFAVLPPARIASAEFLDEVVDAYAASSPLMEFLCDAVGLEYA